MTTTVLYPDDVVDLDGRLEPRALAGSIAADAHQRVAEAVTLTIDWLEEEGRPLNELQKIKLLECVLRCTDGFERATLEELAQAFSKIERSDDGN